MQIELNGKRNITLDFDAPKKFKLFKDGAEVPYIRTGKNSFRLGRNVDGVVELEEIIEKPKIVKPMQLQPQQMALVNPNDVIMINQAAQQLEIEQGLLSETQKQIGLNQEYLDVQQQRINEAVSEVKNLETNNAERITATESGMFNLAGEIANVENNANEGINLTIDEIKSHENADNPHNITKKTIGLDKVDNTADIDKPVSKKVQAELDKKADKTDIQAIREEIGEYQEKSEKISNALSTYTGGLASMSDHRELEGRDFPDQHPIGAITGLQNALDGKVSKTDSASKVYGTDEDGNQTLYNADSFGKVDDVKVNGESVVEDKVANLGTMALENASDYSTKDVADTLYAAISYETTIDNHIANKNNPHEVTKSQVGLGNVDNTSDLDKPISTATQTALDGKADKSTTYTKTEVDNALSGKQNSLSSTQMDAVNSGIDSTKVSQIATNTSNISNLQSGKADKSTTLAGYGITNAYTKTEVDNALSGKQDSLSTAQLDAVNSGINSTKVAQIATNTNDISSLQSNKADKATTLAGYGITDAYTKTEVDTALSGKQNNLDTTQMAAVNSGANTTNIGQIATNTSDIGTINGKIPSAASSSNQLADKSYVDTADNNLQSQIDAITAASDVTDIVGTYAELQAYDTSSLPNNSIIKVLQDESRDDETTYYRWVITGGVGSWILIGEEGPYYTKSETDTLLQAKQNEITSSNKLSADLVDDTNSTNKFVTASDINTWNAKQNALTAGTGIDITSNTISNSGVRSISTGATNGTISVNTNGTSAEVAVYGLGSAAYTASTAYDVSGSASTAETNAKNYADSLASNYATAAQGALADTALQSGDNISELNNNAGYITGITSSDVTTALGYTPYNSSNPSGYQANVIETVKVNGTALTPTNKAVDITVPTKTSDLNNDDGFITGITSSDVTTALGYTPYDSSNPSGYTDNVGTVTSVNNTSPDSNGNVTLTIPAAQVNSDWNANSGVAQILNKPTAFTGADGINAGTSGFVPAPSATDNNKYLKGDGTWEAPAGVVVDQTYDSTSTNAQSGTAVASAISTKANDSDVVKLTGNQTVGGTKTFTDVVVSQKNSSTTGNANQTGYKIADNNLDTSILPSYKKQYYNGTFDKNDQFLGWVDNLYDTDGSSTTGIYARTRNTANTGNVTYHISITANKDGTFSTYSPTPTEDTTSSTQIDTVGARNTKLQSYALDSDVVKTSSNQIIDGIKTFRSEERLASGFSVYDTRVTKGTNPSSTVYKSVFTINDSTYSGGGTWQSMRLAICELSINTEGKTDFYFGPYKNEANSTAGSLIHCIYDKANNIGYATCTASDVNNSIVTTTGISKASDGYVKLGNGIIIQWGEVSTWSSNVATATFPIAFSSRPFGFSITRRSGASTTNDGGNYYARDVSTTSMSIYRTSSNTGTLSWIAIGY